jgi:hypothetical protein
MKRVHGRFPLREALDCLVFKQANTVTPRRAEVTVFPVYTFNNFT